MVGCPFTLTGMLHILQMGDSKLSPLEKFLKALRLSAMLPLVAQRSRRSLKIAIEIVSITRIQCALSTMNR